MIDDNIEEVARLDDEEYYDSLSDNDRCFVGICLSFTFLIISVVLFIISYKL